MPERPNGFFKITKFKVVVLTAVLSVAVAFSTKDFIWEKFHWNVLKNAFPNFEVLEARRTVDLTQWTPTNPKNPDELSGKAIFTDWYTVRKIRDEGKEFCILATSSGSDPRFTSQTHPVTQKPIDRKFEWWGVIKNQDIAILDVSKEHVNQPFRANFESVRYQGFADTNTNWCSIGVFHPTQKLVLHIDFPKKKMGRRFVFSSSFFYNRDDFRVIEGSTAHYTTDSTSLTWTVDNPVVGNAYRIDWDW
jgi:hypothetical protein